MEQHTFARIQALYILQGRLAHLSSWDCLCSCFACLFFFAFPRVNIFWKGMKIWQSLLSVCVQNKVVGNVLHHRGILPGYSKWSRNPSPLEVSEKWTKLAITCPINFTALVLFKHQNEDVICRRKVALSSLGETIYRLSVFGFPLLEWVGGGEGRGGEKDGEGYLVCFLTTVHQIKRNECYFLSYIRPENNETRKNK